MRLESALFSSKEGLNVNGQAIAVAGDNISNSNTTGYKTSRLEFSDMLSEGLDGRQSTTIDSGGNGPVVQDIRQIHEPGTLEFTGRQLDIGIGGGGFFLVGDTANPLYTRAGNFSIDSTGLLVTADGQPVLGVGADGTTLQTINMQDVDLAGSATATASVFGNLDASAANTTAPGEVPASFLALGQSASFISNLTTYDSLGASHDITLAYFKTGTNAWTVQSYIDAGDVGGTAGVPAKAGPDLNLTFTGAGVIDEANKAAAVVTLNPAYSNGATAGNFTVDFSSYSQYSAPSQLAGLTQDGQGTGNVTSYEFNKGGDIQAVLDSGLRSQVGQLALARFVNVDGLDRVGNGMFRTSGNEVTRTISKPTTGGAGTIQGSSLEASTVDISDQFTKLILFQRGYQASSQTLNVANQMLRDTLGLIR
jgi:flagellar hook protein FlgE